MGDMVNRRNESAERGAGPVTCARRADAGGRQRDALEGARPRRARVRPPGELDGPQDRAHHRHGAGEVQDRDDEPRLQHAPAGAAREGGGRARLSWCVGGVCVASPKTAPPLHAGHQEGPARPSIHHHPTIGRRSTRRKRVLFEVPSNEMPRRAGRPSTEQRFAPSFQKGP